MPLLQLAKTRASLSKFAAMVAKVSCALMVVAKSGFCGLT